MHRLRHSCGGEAEVCVIASGLWTACARALREAAAQHSVTSGTAMPAQPFVRSLYLPAQLRQGPAHQLPKRHCNLQLP